MTSNVADFAGVRWERDTKPSAHSVSDALHAALRGCAEFEPQHCIVVFGKLDEQGVTHTRFMQAGSFTDYAQIGLLEITKGLMVG